MPKPQGRNFRGNRFQALTGTMFPSPKKAKKPITRAPAPAPEAKPTAAPEGTKKKKAPALPPAASALLTAMSKAVKVAK